MVLSRVYTDTHLQCPESRASNVGWRPVGKQWTWSIRQCIKLLDHYSEFQASALTFLFLDLHCSPNQLGTAAAKLDLIKGQTVCQYPRQRSFFSTFLWFRQWEREKDEGTGRSRGFHTQFWHIQTGGLKPHGLLECPTSARTADFYCSWPDCETHPTNWSL